MQEKTVLDSTITLSQVIFPKETNDLGMATAGTILKAIDITASLTAGKHSHLNIVTASLDRMDFIAHAYRWELIETTCRLTRVWNTSMEIEVIVEAENTRAVDVKRRKIAQGYLVFVALDDQFNPFPIPALALKSDHELRRSEEADLRKANRSKEKAQLAKRHLTAIAPDEFSEDVLRTMTPDDANIHHNVFGGVILELIHQAGEKAAFRHVNGPVISVRQDRMSFDQPAYIGEEVKAQAVVTRTWNTSMEVQVDVIARDYKTGETRQVARSYLVFIAQDPKTGDPKPAKPFEPKTERQQQRWTEAGVRRAIRLEERDQLLGSKNN